MVITGSELVGLIPLEALLSAGRHYLEVAGENTWNTTQGLVACSHSFVGVGSDLKPFDPGQSIIEYQIASDGPLVRQTLRDFTDLLSSDTSSGGGSIAALCGALANGLAAMVGQLSTRFQQNRGPMLSLDPVSDRL